MEIGSAAESNFLTVVNSAANLTFLKDEEAVEDAAIDAESERLNFNDDFNCLMATRVGGGGENGLTLLSRLGGGLGVLLT